MREGRDGDRNYDKKMPDRPYILFAASLLLFLLFTVDYAAAAAIAKFTVVEGKVDVLKEGVLPAVQAKVGDSLFVRDVIRTKSNAAAEIAFVDGTTLKVSQRSRLDISEYVAEDSQGKRIITLPRGKVEASVPARLAKQISTSPKENRFEIHTPNAVAGVRGTYYIVLFDNDITWLLVREGLVNFFNPSHPDMAVSVAAGQIANIPLNLPPTKRDATEGEKQRIEQASKTGSSASELAEGLVADGALVALLGGSEPSAPPPQELPRVLPPPAFEVGRTTLSGSLIAGPPSQFDFISVFMKDVIFLAPSTGQAPSIWKTDTISGSYSFGSNLVNGVSSIPVSDGKGITGNFNVSQWGTNTWSGSASGTGSLSGGSYTGPVSFQGGVNGAHTGGTVGTFSGTGSGTASK